MTEHGLIQQGWTFKFDSAKRRFGVCKYRPKVIGLSSHLTELNDIERVRNTILHEIAHALVGASHGHDNVWRRKAIEIGCDGERCCDVRAVVTPESRYIAICPTCNHTHKRHKMTSKLLLRQYSCGLCSRGSYNPKHKLEWILNPKI